jgi:membrane dipeptidase
LTVADHVEHIAKVTSKKHVGLGSDYDGIEAGPQGLEDVSKYPSMWYSRRFTFAAPLAQN